MSTLDRRRLVTDAIRQIRQLRNTVEVLKRQRTKIAVVGMACRFPAGGDSPDAFWDALCQRRDGIVETPPDRWDPSGYEQADQTAAGALYLRYGGFLQCPLDRFDAQLFGISPREARSVDPQQRLLLELTWEALENAAIPPSSLSGTRAGVFVGISSQDYGKRTLSVARIPEIDGYALTGTHPSVAAGRLAYVFGLRGPAMAIDTACSSSLVAVHQACESLCNGACDLAIVGGVNALLSPDTTVSLGRLRALSPDARCKTFDRRANGYVRAEGCGVVILKRLADAETREDPVVATILGSALNQDGRSNGLTAPNGLAQVDVIERALGNASVSSEQVGYIECHGTGTELGDSIEVASVSSALRGQPDSEKTSLVLGAAKTNVGHLEAAAGLVGLIKAVLAVDRGLIPPNLHFEEPNPMIDWSATLTVPTEPCAWPTEGPRFAGVSSFGFSGTNAHVVIGEKPERRRRFRRGPEPSPPPLAILVSAATDRALRDTALRWAESLRGATQMEAANLAFTAATSRQRLGEILIVRGEDASAVAAKLASFAQGEITEGCFRGELDERPQKTAFVFSGGGLPAAVDASTLYQRYASFRRTVDDCASKFPASHQQIRQFLARGSVEESAVSGDPLAAPACLFVLQVALAELWQSWGVTPEAVVGHGVGEVAACYVADMLSLGDAADLITQRASFLAASRNADAVPGCGGAFRVPVPSPPAAIVVSSVSGKTADEHTYTESYWATQTRGSHDLTQGIEQLKRLGIGTFVQCGLGDNAVARVADDLCTWLPSVDLSGDDKMFDSLCRLAARTGQFPAGALFPLGRRVKAPNYPFQRQRHWIDASVALTPPTPTVRQSDEPAAEAKALSIDDVRDHLAEIVAAVLGCPVEDIAEDGDLYGLGLDSIMIFEIAEQLRSKFGWTLSARSITALTDGTRPVLTLAELGDCVQGWQEARGGAASSGLSEKPIVWKRDAAAETPFADALPHPGGLECGRAEVATDVWIEYLRVGSGEPLLLLPPLQGTIGHWIAFASLVARQYQVVAISLPGSGRSTAKPECASVQWLASMLCSLLDGLGVDQRLHVMGWSFGGFVAQRLAIAYPQRVASLSLVCSSASLGQSPIEVIKANFERLAADLTACIERVGDDRERDELVALLNRAGQGSDPLSILPYITEGQRFRSIETLPTISCPTLVVSGALDMVLPPWHSEVLRRAIPRARHEILQGAGHFIPLFQRRTLAALLNAHTGRRGHDGGTGEIVRRQTEAVSA